MKDGALKDIKNISIKTSIEAVEHLIKNSIDKNKIEKIYTDSLEQVKVSLKSTKAQIESVPPQKACLFDKAQVKGYKYLKKILNIVADLVKNCATFYGLFIKKFPNCTVVDRQPSCPW